MRARGLLLVLLGCCAIAQTQEPKPEPEVPAVPLPKPFVPQGESALMGISREMFPGIGVWTPELRTGVSSWATRESVGDGLGMRIEVPLAFVGRVILDQTGVTINEQRNDLRDWSGISFWVKGDGSGARGLIGLGAGLEHIYQFPLTNTEWQKVFVDWSDFRPAINANETTQFVNLGIMLPEENRDWYWVKEVKTYTWDRDRRVTVYEHPPTAQRINPYAPLLLHYDTLRVEESDGIELRVQGSGSDGIGRILWSWSDEEPFTFGVVNKEQYTTLRIPWRDLPPPLEVDSAKRYLSIGMNPSFDTTHHFVIDRLHYFRDRRIEAITPTEPQQLPGELPASNFTVRREKLEHLREKIRNQERLTIVFVGDEIMQGAGLFYTFRADRLPFTRTYWSLFGLNLLSKTEYEKLSLVYEIYDVSERTWYPITVTSAQRKRFNVVALGLNGLSTNGLLPHLEKIRSFDPDLIVLQFGVNDYLYSDPKTYHAALTEVVEGLQSERTTVLLSGQVPIADAFEHSWLEGSTYWQRSVLFEREARRVADRFELPYLDTLGAFQARGIQCLGDLYASHTQPNRRGHYTLAMLYMSFLADDPEDPIKIWRAVPDF